VYRPATASPEITDDYGRPKLPLSTSSSSYLELSFQVVGIRLNIVDTNVFFSTRTNVFLIFVTFVRFYVF